MAAKKSRASKVTTKSTDVATEQPSAEVSKAGTRTLYSRTNTLLALSVVLVLIVAGFFAWNYKKAQDKAAKAEAEIARLSNPQEAAKEEVRELTEKVSKLVEVPKESPTIATVNDPSKLEGQSFFVSAQKGDKVLIFTQAKRAILYRPSTNKVIESAPVNIGDNADNGSAQTVPTTPAQ